jgi:hypothetical protein
LALIVVLELPFFASTPMSAAMSIYKFGIKRSISEALTSRQRVWKRLIVRKEAHNDYGDRRKTATTMKTTTKTTTTTTYMTITTAREATDYIGDVLMLVPPDMQHLYQPHFTIVDISQSLNLADGVCLYEYKARLLYIRSVLVLCIAETASVLNWSLEIPFMPLRVKVCILLASSSRS